MNVMMVVMMNGMMNGMMDGMMDVRIGMYWCMGTWVYGERWMAGRIIKLYASLSGSHSIFKKT